MNIVAHILFPIASVQFTETCRPGNKPRLFSWKQILIIGICGGLPDILSPHTGLEDRYGSFAHSLSFLLLGLLTVLLLSRQFSRLRGLFFCCYFATAFHLFCDMIAGGINLYAPFGRLIIGHYYIPFRYWFALDIAAILFCLVPPVCNRIASPAKKLVLSGGYILAILGSAFVLANLDSERVIFKHTPAFEADQAQAMRARLIWNTLYEKWKSGTFESAPAAFNADMRKALSPQMQERLFKQFSGNYGQCKEITFVESITGRFGYPRICIYRFKCSVTGTAVTPEIGILFDSSGKVSGLRFSSTFSRSLI